MKKNLFQIEIDIKKWHSGKIAIDKTKPQRRFFQCASRVSRWHLDSKHQENNITSIL